MQKFNDFMKVSNFFYKTMGMFAYKDPIRKVNRKTQIIMNLIFWASFVNLNVTVVAEIVYLVKAIGTFSSFLEATALAPCIGFCFLTEFKLSYTWTMSENIVELMNGLQALYPTDERSQKIYKVDHYLKVALRLGKFYSSIMLVTIWSFNLLPLSWSLLEFYTSSDIDVEFKWRMAYLTWYPFEINNIPVYTGVYITHIMAGCTAAGGSLACDVFMFNLIFLLCMNFNYIEENIHRKQEIDKLIKHHQIILE